MEEEYKDQFGEEVTETFYKNREALYHGKWDTFYARKRDDCWFAEWPDGKLEKLSKNLLKEYIPLDEEDIVTAKFVASKLEQLAKQKAETSSA